MASSVLPLIEVFRQIPDPRHKRGIRRPLPALLALPAGALPCGYRTDDAIAEWGRDYDPAFLAALGFTRQTAPGGAACFQVFRKLDRQQFEALLGLERSDAVRVLWLARQHWHIANRPHDGRDMTFDEDRAHVRVGSIPEVTAVLRNLVMGLIRLTGTTHIVATTRRMAVRPWEALALLGVSMTLQ